MRKNIFSLDDEQLNVFWISILLPLVSLVSTMGINFMIKRIGVLFCLLILAGIVLMVLVSELLTIIIVRSTHKEKVNSQLDSVTKEAFITAFRDLDIGVIGINGVYPEEEIAQMELTNEYDCIWLISHDLLTEIEEGVYSGVVYQNLKKGIKYTYFVPWSETNEHRIEMIKKRCNNSKNLSFYFLNNDFFFLVPQIDFAIYEPYKSFDNGKKGYMGINIEGLKGRYETLMNHSFLDAMIAKLESIQKNSGQVR